MQAALFLHSRLASKAAAIHKIVEARGWRVSQARPDLVIAIGGDGTVLQAEKRFPNAPILAFNAGSLGFLCDCSFEDLDAALKKYSQGKYKIDEMLKLDLLINGKKVDEAMNEVDITSKTPGRALDTSISINKRKIASFVGDGVLIATPLGSTAYNASAGGSVVEPSVEAMSIVPLNPHFSKALPLVIGPDKTVSVSLDTHVSSAAAVVDGLREHPLSKNSKIEVRVSKSKARLVRCQGDYWQRLASLLG
jgi:NAD+ kinase